MNSLQYIKYINNIIKNLKTVLFSFSNEEILFLKNMFIQLNKNEHINKYFSQTCLKRGIVIKQNGQLINDLANLTVDLNQFYSKIYVDLLEDISKYLNDYDSIDGDVKGQLELLENALVNKINKIDVQNKQTTEYNYIEPHMQVLTDSIVRNLKFSRIGKLSDDASNDNIKDNIQIIEREILNKKVEESDVRDVVDEQIYDEVNRINGFYNNNDKNKNNYLGYYD